MSESHVLRLRSLTGRLAARIGGVDGIECKRFFGGAAAYVDGRIFMTLTPVGLALKLAPSDRVLLHAKGAGPLQYFPNAPIKKDYVLLPDGLAEDEAGLAPFFARSLSFVVDR